MASASAARNSKSDWLKTCVGSMLSRAWRMSQVRPFVAQAEVHAPPGWLQNQPVAGGAAGGDGGDGMPGAIGGVDGGGGDNGGGKGGGKGGGLCKGHTQLNDDAN